MIVTQAHAGNVLANLFVVADRTLLLYRQSNDGSTAKLLALGIHGRLSFPRVLGSLYFNVNNGGIAETSAGNFMALALCILPLSSTT